MPEIIINTCELTPNYCALEAIAKFMRLNYTARDTYSSRTIKVESGRVLKVEELPHDDSKSFCSCSFKVSKVDPDMVLKVGE